MREHDVLLPCPFCGKSVDLSDPDTLYPSGIVWRKTDYGKEYGTRMRLYPQDGECYELHCVSCGVVMSGDCKNEAIDKWQKRT